jgi:ribose-phosphate pyrophosphokinase
MTGSAHVELGAAVAKELGLPLGTCRSERFPDGEIQVQIDDHEVEGEDVAIVQPTPTPNDRSDPVLELLLIADACHRVGAASIFAIVPYFGYARQDRRKRPGEPLGVRVMAQVLATAPVERLVTIDPHSHALEASLDMPVETLTAAPLLVEALKSDLPQRDLVVVAPSLGAVRLARELARLLRAPVALVHDAPRAPIVGDVRGRLPIIVTDMVSTGEPALAAARALRESGSHDDVRMVATHAALCPGVLERLREAGLRRLVMTDTLAPPAPQPGVTIVSVAPLLAASIRRTSTRRRMAHFMLHP